MKQATVAPASVCYVDCAGCASVRGDEEAEVLYKVWVQTWVAREEKFLDRDSAERFRLKLAASCPTLAPQQIKIVPERTVVGQPLPPAA